MTYIIGLKHPGINAIISDARVTFREPQSYETGKNNALKTGILVPGCIFGRVGSDVESARFVVRLRESLKNPSLDSSKIWGYVERFAELYEFPTGVESHFQILLSTRLQGDPDFYILDSKNGLNKVVFEGELGMLSLGSGNAILQSLNEGFVTKLRDLQEYLIDEIHLTVERARSLSPYFISLWLSELSMTFERNHLETANVGGLFSFIAQTREQEIRQGPTIFIFSSVNVTDREIFSYIYKLAYLKVGLYIEDHNPPGTEATDLNRNIDRVLLYHPASDEEQIDGEITRSKIADAELARLPFFVFCGLGYTEPHLRGGFSFLTSTNGTRQELFDGNGLIIEELRADIVNNLNWLSSNRTEE